MKALGVPTELVIYPEAVQRVKADRLRGPDGALNAEDVERVVASS